MYCIVCTSFTCTLCVQCVHLLVVYSTCTASACVYEVHVLYCVHSMHTYCVCTCTGCIQYMYCKCMCIWSTCTVLCTQYAHVLCVYMYWIVCISVRMYCMCMWYYTHRMRTVCILLYVCTVIYVLLKLTQSFKSRSPVWVVIVLLHQLMQCFASTTRRWMSSHIVLIGRGMLMCCR